MFETYGYPVPNIDGKTEYMGLAQTDLIARMIYSEALSESYVGKQGCMYVFLNRLVVDLDEFGHGIFDIITKPGSFDGMTKTSAHAPTLSDPAWYESCYIASIGTSNTNPVGHCLWFVKNEHFNDPNFSRIIDGSTYYRFKITSSFKKVVEKVVIGGHTFFRVEGSDYIF